MTYLYQCPQCKAKVEKVRKMADRRKPVKCDCGGDMGLIFSLPSVVLWPPGPRSGQYHRPHGGFHLEHVEPEGRTFYSKRELKDYCKTTGMKVGALL